MQLSRVKASFFLLFFFCIRRLQRLNFVSTFSLKSCVCCVFFFSTAGLWILAVKAEFEDGNMKQARYAALWLV